MLVSEHDTLSIAEALAIYRCRRIDDPAARLGLVFVYQDKLYLG